MKIAQVAPLYEAVPPKLYGGTERIVSFLTEALVELGHQVTLFTSADARTRAELVCVRDQAIRLDPARFTSDLGAHLSMMDELRSRQDSFDLIHFHTELIHFPFFETIASRTVTTLHGRLDLKDLPEVYRRWPEYPLVSISDSQRRPLPGVRWAQTVHHGVDGRQFTPVDEPRADYLAFLGRISPEKRVDRAIEVARKIGLPLRIAAKIELLDEHYYERVKPTLEQPGVEFVGEIGDAEKSEFLGNAAALLFPIDWPEPFGLVMIEAMACGTPVIAWNNGSVPEVIDDGITGFIVSNVDEAVKAIGRAAQLPRQKIRDVFEERFSATTMAQNYVRLYQALLAGERRQEAAA
ncbi:MAG: glycosyltransferase family 4 protein [Methylobacteriaceae bacterium]|nr:glycosyltransferase family 4 protein [Methylobacteriaceae bacterium]